MRKTSSPGPVLLAVLLTVAAMVGCDQTENPLAPYEGERPLIVQRLTQSFAPDLQWVGGRVAAVGINRGGRAALDSTLVWMNSTEGDNVASPVYVRESLDADAVMKVGGTPTDSLADGVTYTFWLATQEALDTGLADGAFDPHAFVDTTFTLTYLLRGRSAGGVSVDFSIFRDQRLLSDAFKITWTPSSQAFRRLAIRNATLGGFTDLLWHVVLPDNLPDSITPPVVIGETPEQALVATPWSGFGTGNHVLWATTSEWDGSSFGFRTTGYAFFQIFGSNFE